MQTIEPSTIERTVETRFSLLFVSFSFASIRVQRKGTCSDMAIGHVNSTMQRRCPIYHGVGSLSLTCKSTNQPIYAGERDEET
jgi:hypothetical protein